jgi:hypothetical protein
MSIGHKHRHTGRRPRRSYRSRFRAERHRRQQKPSDEHGPYVPGHDGRPFGNGAFGECGIVRSVNTVMGDFLADAEALLAARLKRVSLDDIARQAQPTPLHPQRGAHHHG